MFSYIYSYIFKFLSNTVKLAILNEPVREKTNNLGSDQVQHRPAFTFTEDGERLEILDLENRGIVLSV